MAITILDWKEYDNNIASDGIFVIYGAGEIGRNLLDKYTPRYFCDKDALYIGSVNHISSGVSIPCLSLDEIVRIATYEQKKIFCYIATIIPDFTAEILGELLNVRHDITIFVDTSHKLTFQKQKKRTSFNPVTVNKIVSIYKYGGSPFVLFDDLGISEIQLFGKEPFISDFVAFLSFNDLSKVKRLISNEKQSLRFFINGWLSVAAISSEKDIDYNKPTVIIDTRVPKKEASLFNNIYLIDHIVEYAYLKCMIFDILKTRNINTKLFIVCPSRLIDVKNRNERENDIIKGDSFVQLDDVPKEVGYVNYVKEHDYSVQSLDVANAIKASNKCWMLGNCLFQLTRNIKSIEETVPSYLTELFLKHNINIEVINCAYAAHNLYHVREYLTQLNIKNGDIIVVAFYYNVQNVLLANKTMAMATFVDMQPYFDRPHDLGEVWEQDFHLNAAGHKEIANKIFTVLNDSGVI